MKKNKKPALVIAQGGTMQGALSRDYIEPAASWRNPMTRDEANEFMMTSDLKRAAKRMARAMYAEDLLPKKPDNLIGVEKLEAKPIINSFKIFRPAEDVPEIDYKVE